MAMALGLDYWLVPQINASYQSNYTMDASKADAAVRTLKHVIETKDLRRFLVGNSELSKNSVSDILLNMVRYLFLYISFY